MSADPCGTEFSCAWRTAKTLLAMGSTKVTHPKQLCIAFRDAQNPCAERATAWIAEQSFCDYHAEVFRMLPGWSPTTYHKPMDPPVSDDMSVIYFARRDMYIKIGTTTRLKRRMVDLGTDCLAWIRGGRNEEQAYHEKFAEHRDKGEWFYPAPEIIDEINVIRKAYARQHRDRKRSPRWFPDGWEAEWEEATTWKD